MRERVLLSAVANESGHVQSQEVTLAKRSRSLSAATRVDPGQNLEEVSGKKNRSLFAATKVDLEQGLEEALGKKILPYGVARESGKGLVRDPVRNLERGTTTILYSDMTITRGGMRIKSLSDAMRGRLLPNLSQSRNLHLSESWNPYEPRQSIRRL